ncbi:uncharacterized protein [Antedon mediterranea]|uniref:uncharacterized protein n=1 Tax=Antedon mediterranea TaxID=105859 RepID=UPI003AF8954A
MKHKKKKKSGSTSNKISVKKQKNKKSRKKDSLDKTYMQDQSQVGSRPADQSAIGSKPADQSAIGSKPSDQTSISSKPKKKGVKKTTKETCKLNEIRCGLESRLDKSTANTIMTQVVSLLAKSHRKKHHQRKKETSKKGKKSKKKPKKLKSKRTQIKSKKHETVATQEQENVDAHELIQGLALPTEREISEDIIGKQHKKKKKKRKNNKNTSTEICSTEQDSGTLSKRKLDEETDFIKSNRKRQKSEDKLLVVVEQTEIESEKIRENENHEVDSLNDKQVNLNLIENEQEKKADEMEGIEENIAQKKKKKKKNKRSSHEITETNEEEIVDSANKCNNISEEEIENEQEKKADEIEGIKENIVRKKKKKKKNKRSSHEITLTNEEELVDRANKCNNISEEEIENEQEKKADEMEGIEENIVRKKKKKKKNKRSSHEITVTNEEEIVENTVTNEEEIVDRANEGNISEEEIENEQEKKADKMEGIDENIARKKKKKKKHKRTSHEITVTNEEEIVEKTVTNEEEIVDRVNEGNISEEEIENEQEKKANEMEGIDENIARKKKKKHKRTSHEITVTNEEEIVEKTVTNEEEIVDRANEGNISEEEIENEQEKKANEMEGIGENIARKKKKKHKKSSLDEEKIVKKANECNIPEEENIILKKKKKKKRKRSTDAQDLYTESEELFSPSSVDNGEEITSIINNIIENIVVDQQTRKKKHKCSSDVEQMELEQYKHSDETVTESFDDHSNIEEKKSRYSKKKKKKDEKPSFIETPRNEDESYIMIPEQQVEVVDIGDDQIDGINNCNIQNSLRKENELLNSEMNLTIPEEEKLPENIPEEEKLPENKVGGMEMAENKTQNETMKSLPGVESHMDNEISLSQQKSVIEKKNPVYKNDTKIIIQKNPITNMYKVMSQSNLERNLTEDEDKDDIILCENNNDESCVGSEGKLIIDEIASSDNNVSVGDHIHSSETLATKKNSEETVASVENWQDSEDDLCQRSERCIIQLDTGCSVAPKLLSGGSNKEFLQKWKFSSRGFPDKAEDWKNKTAPIPETWAYDGHIKNEKRLQKTVVDSFLDNHWKRNRKLINKKHKESVENELINSIEDSDSSDSVSIVLPSQK